MDGFEVMERLKSDARTAGIPVIFLTGSENPKEELKALRMGAVDYVVKPFYPEVLMTKIERAIERSEVERKLYTLVQQKMEEAEKFRLMTYLDPLTTMWNRTYFENQVNLYLQEKDPKGFFFILDIDNFKQINDALGHTKGDQVLLQLAEVLKKAQTESVLTARLAGDEFLIFLKNVADSEYASLLAESVIMEISGINVENDSNISVSMGISSVGQNTENFSELYRQADQALYEAKRHGKADYNFYGMLMKKEA